MTPLKAPFPYFGGKRVVAAEVWARFGDVPNSAALSMDWTITISRMATSALCLALGRPPLFSTGIGPRLDCPLLIFIPMQVEMLRPVHRLKIGYCIVQLVAVNVVYVMCLWDFAMMRFPNNMSTKTPYIRLRHLDIHSLLSTSLVSGSDSLCSYWNRIVSMCELTVRVTFHTNSISCNYVGGKCRH